MLAMTAGTIVLGTLVAASVAVRKSIITTDRYVTGINNSTRLMDYVAQDLRRAVRVGTLVGGANTAYKSDSTGFSVTTTNILTINVPDYYASNTPNNGAGSTFKTSRYQRSTLDTASTYWISSGSIMNGVVPWAEATTKVGSSDTARYAPAATSNGEIQVRYYRAARSQSDPSVCYFRGEYPAASNTAIATKEIAERISNAASTTTLTVFVTTPANGRSVFTVQSGFTSRYGNTPTTAGTREVVGITSRNPRRD